VNTTPREKLESQLCDTVNELREQLAEITTQRNVLLSALNSAAFAFDLLAGYGLPGEALWVMYEAMKSIAKDEVDKARTAIAKAETAKTP
jgi:hypothetical protein